MARDKQSFVQDVQPFEAITFYPTAMWTLRWKKISYSNAQGGEGNNNRNCMFMHAEQSLGNALEDGSERRDRRPSAEFHFMVIIMMVT
ncbi:hypothetical protein MUK42_05450 [Musa troglodytarum]|uniref:Uncharacterized protein n=1 Tax=Musa troglodytarum TaxID=320322 RepID=A0A9E7EVZ7_9LILI|nr:hypothetical protein MUK42_05450 [Musa troglodytarum]